MFRVLGQLGQLWQPLLMRQPLAPQRSNATRCSDAGVVWRSRAVWGSQRALASGFDAAARKTSMSIDSSRADARKANIAHLCIPAATRRWKRRALVPYCSSACVNEP